MPLSIIIDAPIEKVYEVLDTPALNSVWNPVIDRIVTTGTDTCDVFSFMGDFKTSKAKTPASVTLTITGSPVLQQLKYELVKLSDNQTRVDGTVVLAGTAHYTTMHRTVGKKLLKNLKRFVEHLHAGLARVDFRKEI